MSFVAESRKRKHSFSLCILACFSPFEGQSSQPTTGVLRAIAFVSVLKEKQSSRKAIVRARSTRTGLALTIAFGSEAFSLRLMFLFFFWLFYHFSSNLMIVTSLLNANKQSINTRWRRWWGRLSYRFLVSSLSCLAHRRYPFLIINLHG